MSYPKGTDLLDLSDSEISAWLDSFETILSDGDGVLWLSTHPIDGSPEVIKKLQDIGKNVFLVTNSSEKTRAEHSLKSKMLNYNFDENNILGTAYLTARYLKQLNFTKKVYLVGPNAVRKELDYVGIQSFGDGPDVQDPNLNVADFIIKNIKQDPDVGAVVVGCDVHISLPKIIRAASYLQDPDCLFIGTNVDPITPIHNFSIPCCGSLIKTIEMTAEREPLMVGKPSSVVGDVLINEFNVNPKRTLMIGDRCGTDILLGVKCGFQTLLCETGVNKKADVQKWIDGGNAEEKLLIPNFIVPRLGRILKYLK